jgi:hypothetical protein
MTMAMITKMITVRAFDGRQCLEAESLRLTVAVVSLGRRSGDHPPQFVLPRSGEFARWCGSYGVIFGSSY